MGGIKYPACECAGGICRASRSGRPIATAVTAAPGVPRAPDARLEAIRERPRSPATRHRASRGVLGRSSSFSLVRVEDSKDSGRAQRTECPFPDAHDKLREAHYFFHRMVDEVHEPEPFRWNLNAFLQAARSVDYLLRSHGEGDVSFATWYKEKLAELQQNSPPLRRLVAGRDIVVHHRALTHMSRVRGGLFLGRQVKFVIGKDEPEKIEFSSRQLLANYVEHLVGFLIDEEHSAIGEQIGVERIWIVEELDEEEDVTIVCFRTLGLLFELMTEAHAFYRVDFSPEDDSEPHEPTEDQLAEVRVLLESDVDPSLIEKWDW